MWLIDNHRYDSIRYTALFSIMDEYAVLTRNTYTTTLNCSWTANMLSNISVISLREWGLHFKSVACQLQYHIEKEHHLNVEIIHQVKARYPNLGVPDELWPEQREVLQKLLDGRHCLAVLPTGFGKTWLMILVPLLMNEVWPINTQKKGSTWSHGLSFPSQMEPSSKHNVIIVTPLHALMVHQQQRFSAGGLPGVAVSKEASMEDIRSKPHRLIIARCINQLSLYSCLLRRSSCHLDFSRDPH